jgi:hypothetical protein
MREMLLLFSSPLVKEGEGISEVVNTLCSNRITAIPKSCALRQVFGGDKV